MILITGAGSFADEDTLRFNFKFCVPEVPHKEDLVHWWWLDESLGKSASDSVGTSHGTLAGDTTWTADSYLTRQAFVLVTTSPLATRMPASV